MFKLLFCTFFVVCFFFKNDHVSARTQNAEELRMETLFDMISAPYREGKELLLKNFEDGIMPLDDLGIALLTHLAGTGTAYKDKTPGDTLDIRIRALSVLGTAGQTGAQAITNLLYEETDANAMAVAFYYLGEAGPADDRRVSTMTRAIRRDAMSENNNNAAQFYLEAIRKIVSTDSGQLPFVLDVLLIMTRVGYSSEIQKNAMHTITQLTKIGD